MPSKLEFYAFPRLKSAKKEMDSNHMDYKSGATFSGQLDGRKRVGHGVFVWPNGDRYKGEYMDNDRHGKGEQIWSDGSKFTGEFVKDTRHGLGEHVWKDGESFKGAYFKDHRHGQGTYTWPDKSCFVGTFYKNKKEGYGIFKFSSGNEFQGLYINDEREGPGLLTYPDGKSDIGLWRKERLVKLCSPIEGAFTMADHTDFEYNPKEHVLTLKVNDPRNPTLNGALNIKLEDSNSNGQSEESLRAMMEKLSRVNFETSFDIFQSSTGESVDLHTLTYDREEYDQAFFDDVKEGSKDSDNSQTALNNTPSLIEMQLHIMKHRAKEGVVKFKVDALVYGNRGIFTEKGPIELMSEELIKAAASGDHETVHALLSKGAVNVNVADRNGHVSLIGAAVHMHQDIINSLLDSGADVNKLNDEGLSALAACHVLFYPIASFKYNIAERYLPVPPGEERIAVKIHMESPEESIAAPPVRQKTQDAEPTPRDHAGFNLDGDFFDVESPEKDVGMEGDEEDGFIPEWDPENDSIEERQSLGKAGSLIGQEKAPTLHGSSSIITSINDFETDQSMRGFEVKVTEDLIERTATAMSKNPQVVSRGISRQEENLDDARKRAIEIAEHSKMEATIRLLLKRGADPNASSVPMPVVFFAIKAADVDAVSILLQKKASTEARLSPDKEGLTPLHIASAIRGTEGVDITKLLLAAGANPNTRALDKDLHEFPEDLSPLDPGVKLKPGLDESVFAYLMELEATGDHQGGRTPLHIACDRDDDYELPRQVVHLLLEHGANPNVLCKGQSPLSLAIASGNDLAIDELLSFNANTSLPLGQSIGSALCVAANTQFEFRRTPQQRIELIDKLVKAGANILAPIAVGPKRQMGTAVDYAYWMFNQDRRIAHMPYHALTHAERDTYNARRKLLSHLGEILREAAVKRERERLEQEEHDGIRSISPSHGFLYTGAGAEPTENSVGRSKSPSRNSSKGGDGSGAEGSKQVAFEATTKDSSGQVQPLVDRDEEVAVSGGGGGGGGGGKIIMTVDLSSGSPNQARNQRLVKNASRSHIRKPLFRYCYECGRSIGVRLSACTRCKEVYYCSKACKIKAWNARHKEECLRLGGRSRSPSPTSHTGLQPSHNSSNNTGFSQPSSQGHAGSNAKGHGGGAGGSNAKAQTRGQGLNVKGQGGSNTRGQAGSIGKGQSGSVGKGSVKGSVNGSVKGQGTLMGSNPRGSHAGRGPGGGHAGIKGQTMAQGSKGSGQGQSGGGDNKVSGQNGQYRSGGGIEAVKHVSDCTDNYSFN